MADINTQELAAALSALAKQSTTMSNHIRMAGETIYEIQEPLEDTQEQYEKHLRKMKGLRSDEAKAQIETLKNIKKVQTTLQKDLIARQNQIKSIEKNIKDAEKQRDKLKSTHEKVVSSHGRLSDEAMAVSEKLEKLTLTIAQEQAAKEQATDAQKTHSRMLDNSSKVLIQQEKQLKRISYSDMAQSFKTGLIGSLKSGAASFIGTKSASDIVSGAYGGFKSALNTGVNPGFDFASQNRIASLGVDTPKMVELLRANRAGVISAGGTDATMKLMENVKSGYRGVMSNDQWAKYAAEQMSILTASGIKPTIQSMGLLKKSFLSLQRSAGLDGEAFNAAISEITSDSGVQARMRGAANEQERQAILSSVATRLAENRLMGISLEQSKAMIRSQAQMDKAGPMARMKRGVRVGMLGSMMGIDGADRYRQLMMSSVAEQNKPENAKFIQNFQNQIANKSGDANQGAFNAANLFTEMASSKLDKEGGIANVDSVFNTKLAEVAKSSDASNASLGKISEGTASAVATLITIKDLLQKSIYGQMIASGASVAGGAISSVAGLAMLSKIGGGAAGAGGWMSKAGGAGKMLTRGGVAGILGVGANMGADYANSTGHSGVGAALNIGGNAASGALLGSMIMPGVGTAIGGVLGGAYGAYKQFGPSSESDQPANPQDATNNALSTQVSQMDQSNAYLKDVASATTNLVAISQKQLALMTMTEKDRSGYKNKVGYRENSGFSNRYVSI